MRLKTDIWVKSYLRARRGAGAFAVVVAHGDDDAGAIFIKINNLDGTASLYGPAAAGIESDGERRFALRHKVPKLPDAEIEALLEREKSFDPDLWIVEIEDRSGIHGLDPWLEQV